MYDTVMRDVDYYWHTGTLRDAELRSKTEAVRR